MWLLNTATAKLRYFPDASHIDRGGYAIVSHTWGTSEQTFQDVQQVIEECHKIGRNPREYVCEKIEKCCLVAESHGFEWVWIDSCCIDKTSSTELSEAINSMFRWYEQAEVCYAYLADVSSGSSLHTPESEFRRSRWHTRGWTLQELIAPSSLLFYSADWVFLGTRSQLSVLLHDITGVWPTLLDRTCGVWQTSIAMRMRWASKRRTTRVEDEAYCLMGLCGVDMPIIYGEGRRAFYRLQLEILKSSPDTSLFTWGSGMTQEYLHNDGYEHIVPLVNPTALEHYLLADSPASFVHYATYAPQALPPPQSHRTDIEKAIACKAKPSVERDSPNLFGSPEVMKFKLTSQGMKCRLPIIEARGLTVAILLCKDHVWGEHLGLCLTPVASDTSASRYHACVGFDNSHRAINTHINCRILGLGSDLHNIQLWGKRVEPEWRTVYIDSYPPYWVSPYGIMHLRQTLRPTAHLPFRVPGWLITKLAMVNFAFEGVAALDGDGWHLIFRNKRLFGSEEAIFVNVGVCNAAANVGGSQLPRPWLSLVLGYYDHRLDALYSTQHDCLTDHLETWRPAHDKRFGDDERTVRVSFRPDILEGSSKLVMHLELEGAVYEKKLRDANVKIPTREELDALQEAKTRTAPAKHIPLVPQSHLLLLRGSEAPKEVPGPEEPTPTTQTSVSASARIELLPPVLQRGTGEELSSLECMPTSQKPVGVTSQVSQKKRPWRARMMKMMKELTPRAIASRLGEDVKSRAACVHLKATSSR